MGIYTPFKMQDYGKKMTYETLVLCFISYVLIKQAFGNCILTLCLAFFAIRALLLCLILFFFSQRSEGTRIGNLCAVVADEIYRAVASAHRFYGNLVCVVFTRNAE